MSGLLHGVGVGPGDPELMTLRAVRLIERAAVVFCPAGQPGRARAIAAEWLASKRVVELELEMRGDRESALRHAAERVRGELGSGEGVYLTEGDPSLYSTFQLLARALAAHAPEIEVRAVPGVSSVTAAAAAAGVSLGLGDEMLAVVPASLPGALLEDVAALFDTTVVLKPSLGGEELRGRLAALGLLAGATLIEEATGPRERIARGEAALEGPVPYFSALLVKGGPGAADPGRVHFVGAGPGPARHLSRRALSLLRRAELVVAADSLVAPEVLALARGPVIGSSSLALEEVLAPMLEAAAQGRVVVRLHSGDPSVYGALSEQIARLRAAGCRYEIVPGVSSVFALAAAMGVELTEPGGTQTVVLTRHGRRVPTPERERLRVLASSRATLAIFLSAGAAGEVERELLEGGLDPDTPAAVGFRVGWPDELVERTTVAGIAAVIRRRGLRRHTLILVGDALGGGGRRSRLYDSGHPHVHRRRSGASRPPGSEAPGLIALTRPGARLARRLAAQAPGCRLLLPDALADPGDEVLGRPADRIPRLYAEGLPLVLFMAVGSAVRLLAPAARDKLREPPVVTVDDGGRFAVSLLGGRAAGANRLAEWVAAVLGAEAVVTTAAERLGLPALDAAIRERGWTLEAGSRLAPLEAAVVNGDPLGYFGPGVDPPPGFDFRRETSARALARHPMGLAVSDRALGPLPPGWVIARPRRLVLGFGCSSTATGAQALELARQALAEAGLAAEGVGAVATIDRRGEHPATGALAQALEATVVAFAAERLAEIEVPTPSSPVQEAVGTPSVAEAAALLAAAGGRLLVAKKVAMSVTVAIAEAPP